MGINLYFSNQLRPLADRLCRNMAEGAAAASVFEPTTIIVPNMNLAKWLKLTLARKTGIVMNVAFAFLEAGLWQMLSDLAPESDPQPALFENEQLKILIHFALTASTGLPAAGDVFDHYLGAGTRGQGAETQLRCWQLAGEMARLFEEYAYHRADMIERWTRTPVDASTGDAFERAQHWLYREVMALKHAWGEYTGRRLASPAEYARRLDDDGRIRPTGTRCHVFGLSQISPLHVRLLGWLQRYYDIHIYSLNPSREYWEDIRTPAEKKWIRRKGGPALELDPEELASGNLFSEPDHPLLSFWGKPGRESIRLLCQLTDYDFHAGFDPQPEPSSVLSAIRHGLLTLEPIESLPSPLVQDTSLQVMACPGIRREVERTYHSILYNLEIDPTLCMTDIAVMVTDMARYKPVVDSVFNRQPSRISYNLVDAHAPTESLFAMAVTALMTLARGNFSRKAVFDLLRNPLVMQKWAYGEDEIAVWIAWTDALGIFHHVQNHQGAGSEMPQAGCFSWRQGLERLRLSRILAASSTGEDGPDAHFEGLVPYADIHSADDRVLETLCQIVAALADTIDRLSLSTASAADWRDIFLAAVDRFIAISDENRGEATVYQSLVGALARLTDHDDLLKVAPGTPLGDDSMWAFIRSHLEGITGGQGDYLTGGVTVSALMPMRPIPFRIIYVLGLEEGRFPGRTPESALDLRHRERRIGDISLAERNRYLFLETLLSVSDKLYLCYVNRDLQKDRQLAPCSVLRQLIRYVEATILGGQAFSTCEVPFRGDSPAYLAPDRINHWSDVLAGNSTLNRLSCYQRSGLWPAFIKRASSAELARAERFSPDFSLPGEAPAASGTAPSATAVTLTVNQLKHFLLDPLGFAGVHHLGIAAPDTQMLELAEVEDEPVASMFPVDYGLRLNSLRRWLAAEIDDAASDDPMASLGACFDALYADRSRKSRVPTGAFADQDRRRLGASVLAYGQLLMPFLDRMRIARQFFSAVHVGDATDSPPPDGGKALALDAATLDGLAEPGGVTAVLSGGLPWVWQDPDGSWHCLILTGSAKNVKHADKYVIGPVLTLAAVRAGGIDCPWSESPRVTLHIVYQGQVLNLEYDIETGPSRRWLSGLLAAVLTPPPLEWIPYCILMDNTALRRMIAGDDASESDAAAFCALMQSEMSAALDVGQAMIGSRVSPDSLAKARARLRPFIPATITVGT